MLEDFDPSIHIPLDKIPTVQLNGMVITMARLQILQQQICDLMAMIDTKTDSGTLFANYAKLTIQAAQEIHADYASRYGQ